MVKAGSETSETTARLHAEQEVDRKVFSIFDEHYHSARKHMPPEAALATAYTAAQNYLTALKESATPSTPSASDTGRVVAGIRQSMTRNLQGGQ